MRLYRTKAGTVVLVAVAVMVVMAGCSSVVGDAKGAEVTYYVTWSGTTDVVVTYVNGEGDRVDASVEASSESWQKTVTIANSLVPSVGVTVTNRSSEGSVTARVSVDGSRKDYASVTGADSATASYSFN